jgi:hypothetical protein
VFFLQKFKMLPSIFDINLDVYPKIKIDGESKC